MISSLLTNKQKRNREIKTVKNRISPIATIKPIRPFAKPSPLPPDSPTMSPKQDAGSSPPAAPAPNHSSFTPMGQMRLDECADLLKLVSGVSRPLEDVVADFLARVPPERRLRFGCAIKFVLEVRLFRPRPVPVCPLHLHTLRLYLVQSPLCLAPGYGWVGLKCVLRGLVDRCPG